MKKLLKCGSIIMTLVIVLGILCVFAVPASAASGSTYSSNPTIAARIDKALAAYGPNSFFTKNGKACSCHATSSIDCVSSPSSCNCLRKVTVDGKTVDLLAVQCFGYARYWQQVLFGAFESNTTKFQKLSGVSGTLTAANTKTWFTNNKSKLHPGTHIRCYNSNHSIVLLGVDYDQGKITYIQSNWVNQSTNNGTWCKVSAITTKTWSDFASTFDTLNYAQVYKNYYTEFPDEVTPPIATDFNPTIKDGIYTLKNVYGGNMLNVSETMTAYDSPLINMTPADGSIQKKFLFKHVSEGKYYIYAVCSEKSGDVYKDVVDVYVGSQNSDVLNLGDSFDTWEKADKWKDCQLFYIVPVGDGKYVIELASMPNAVMSAKSADEASTNGGAVTLRDYADYTTQQWYFYNESGTAPVDPSIDNSLTYTVNYDANGGTNAPAKQTKVHGTDLILSADAPSKAGHSFLGWSTSNDSTVEYQVGATYSANANVTLYAVWKANEYTVNYDANGGTNAPAKQTKVYGTDLILSATAPSKAGHRFLGWSTSNDSTVEYQAGATYSANENVTLYAVWKADEYTVNYDANGGTNASSAQTKVYGTDLTLSADTPSKAGHSFLGWSTSNDSTVEYQAGATYIANADVTLYAVWKADEYTVNYDANGGSNVPPAQTKMYETALTLSDVIPQKNGYTFLGWAVSSDSTTVTYQAGGSYTNNSDVTLYAVWKQNVVIDDSNDDNDSRETTANKETTVDKETTADKETTPDKTENANKDTDKKTDSEDKKDNSGCGSSLALSSLALISALGAVGAVLSCKKKKED